jgi:choline dehydrogenase-like flavoprotein
MVYSGGKKIRIIGLKGGTHGEDSESNKFDAIIIGSGPGGATVARDLSKKKKKVLILEWGGNAPIRGSFLQIAQFGVFPGRSLLFTDMTLMAMFRAIITGGSSIMYYATAFDPPLAMLKSYGVDISKEVEELKKELPIAPLSDELTGPMAKRIMESAQGLGHNWQKLNKFIYQDKCRINCDKCNLGCPYEAKWNARMYIDEAVKKQNEKIALVRLTFPHIDSYIRNLESNVALSQEESEKLAKELEEYLKRIE